MAHEVSNLIDNIALGDIEEFLETVDDKQSTVNTEVVNSTQTDIPAVKENKILAPPTEDKNEPVSAKSEVVKTQEIENKKEAEVIIEDDYFDLFAIVDDNNIKLGKIIESIDDLNNDTAKMRMMRKCISEQYKHNIAMYDLLVKFHDYVINRLDESL